MEEEQEDQERGAKQWVNHDGTPEDDTPKEMYMHNTLPVAPEQERLLESASFISIICLL